MKEQVMANVTIEEAQATLPELIHRLAAGEEVAIVENDQVVAALISRLQAATPGLRPPPGLGKGIITIVSDDEDYLSDFVEYMP